MPNRQLDLFAARPAPRPARNVPQAPPRLDVAALGDEALTAALREARLADAEALAAEAGRRRLTSAIPALETLCRRFAGFGGERLVPEQVAAFEALAEIAGPAAMQTVQRLIVKGVVEGPTLRSAAAAAIGLGVPLPADILLGWFRADEPVLRAAACRLVRPWPDPVPLLLDRLDDLDVAVALAAACALGRLGRIEARAALYRELGTNPSAEVIDAVTPIADEACMVMLGRVAGIAPDLAGIALEALDGFGDPRADRIAAALRRPSG